MCARTGFGMSKLGKSQVLVRLACRLSREFSLAVDGEKLMTADVTQWLSVPDLEMRLTWFCGGIIVVARAAEEFVRGRLFDNL